jgi:RNA polymerase sigma-70 factor (ECF subfamily)
MRESDEQRWSALMVRAQAGDEADYRQLLVEVAEAIHAFLRSRFGSSEFVEDCVQESLIAVHQARHTYDPRRPFRPWLFAIVRNKAIDYLRRQRTRARVHDHFQTEQEILSQPGSARSEPGERFELGILDGLSEPHREVLVLTKVIGFSIAETSAKLGISESAVKVRVHRAVGKLRRLLEAGNSDSGIK